MASRKFQKSRDEIFHTLFLRHVAANTVARSAYNRVLRQPRRTGIGCRIDPCDAGSGPLSGLNQVIAVIGVRTKNVIRSAKCESGRPQTDNGIG